MTTGEPFNVSDVLEAVIRFSKNAGGPVNATATAKDIAAQFPDCGMTVTELENEIVRLAVKAGLPVESGDT